MPAGPKWVIGRHSPDLSESPLYPRKRTSEAPAVTRYGPKTDSRNTTTHLTTESVLEGLSPLHDHHEVLVRIGDEVQVGDGVAVNQQQICQGTSLNDADLTWIGIARP